MQLFFYKVYKDMFYVLYHILVHIYVVC